MESNWLLLLYAMPLVGIAYWYLKWRGKHEGISRAVLAAAHDAGLTEPPSIHPLIDHNLCIGCGACVAACPEQATHPILGMIRGKAHLISPADCIGHSACERVCPVKAITLVFGTERRGVDIPLVKPDFETNVPGIFIAGELGGMGLIRNAVEQGRQAMDSIHTRAKKQKNRRDLDAVIIGAGPAGFSAALAALEKKMRVVTIEQDSLGGTVAHYPRGKLVMTQPAVLPIVGKMNYKEAQKEELIAYWQGVEKQTAVKIQYGERVESVKQFEQDEGFEVITNKARYQALSVLLAIGRRGTPRTLDVPGEELSKVTYRLVDPAQYRGKHVLVVGGGDSALEAATSIAEEKDTTVTLSYRSEVFSRAKLKNRQKTEALAKHGRLMVIFESTVSAIRPQEVVLNIKGKEQIITNDAVIVSAGGILPTEFLKSIGIEIETKYGTV